MCAVSNQSCAYANAGNQYELLRECAKKQGIDMVHEHKMKHAWQW